MKYGRKDNNHNSIKSEMIARGLNVLDVSQLNLGCDLIVRLKTQNNKYYYVEIKNQEHINKYDIGKIENYDKYLTENEIKCKKFFKEDYIIITDYEEFRKQIK